MDAWFQRVWYGRSPWAWLLWPLSLLFAFVSAIRRVGYSIGVFRKIRVAQPVVVVGNITVGGTGKTPLVIWLAQQLSRRGYRPAVITRGYGGESRSWPVDVAAESDPALVGDEAVLLAKRCGVPVVAGPDRVADAKRAIERGANVIISDDGLQHYRLARDFEIAVIDGTRSLGNGMLLPAGPLRESRRRLGSVNAVAVTVRLDQSSIDSNLIRHKPIIVQRVIREAHSLRKAEVRPLSSFAARPVHAIAGIGNPETFFAALRAYGLDVDSRPLRDHAALSKADLTFNDNAPVFMTEKDAVKCRELADERCWAVPLQVDVHDTDRFFAKIDAVLRK